jgi:hypothetical protein
MVGFKQLKQYFPSLNKVNTGFPSFNIVKTGFPSFNNVKTWKDIGTSFLIGVQSDKAHFWPY